jgi:hypothetical protein
MSAESKRTCWIVIGGSFGRWNRDFREVYCYIGSFGGWWIGLLGIIIILSWYFMDG